MYEYVDTIGQLQHRVKEGDRHAGQGHHQVEHLFDHYNSLAEA